MPDFPLLHPVTDAANFAAWGCAALLLAAVCWIGDWHRIRRRRDPRRPPEAVGWVPWTPLFFTALLAGGTLLLIALAGWRGG